MQVHVFGMFVLGSVINVLCCCCYFVLRLAAYCISLSGMLCVEACGLGLQHVVDNVGVEKVGVMVRGLRQLDVLARHVTVRQAIPKSGALG